VRLCVCETYDSPVRRSHPHSRCPRHTPRSGGYTSHCHSGSPVESRWAALQRKTPAINTAEAKHEHTHTQMHDTEHGPMVTANTQSIQMT
jgi:hypothetical protein